MGRPSLPLREPCSRPGACPVVYHGARSPPKGAADTHTGGSSRAPTAQECERRIRWRQPRTGSPSPGQVQACFCNPTHHPLLQRSKDRRARKGAQRASGPGPNPGREFEACGVPGCRVGQYIIQINTRINKNTVLYTIQRMPLVLTI